MKIAGQVLRLRWQPERLPLHAQGKLSHYRAERDATQKHDPFSRWISHVLVK
jgi:hypothetical protein